MARHRMIATVETTGDVDRLRRELVAAKLRLDAATVALDRERERGDSLLAAVRSFFTDSVASGGTTEAIAHHFRGRLEVLARFHHHPSNAYDLEMLIRDELRDFQFGEDARITLAGRAICLQPAEAQAVGLAIHELVTNALKFGALSHPAGRLEIGWAVVDGEMRLDWTESGTPRGTGHSCHYGVGRAFIEQALPAQLAAQTRFALHETGLHCQIAFALKGLWEQRKRGAITVFPERNLLQ